MIDRRRIPEISSKSNRCPKADDIKCGCGEILIPHSYIKTMFGNFKYYYTCRKCSEEYTSKKYKNNR